MKKIIVVLCLLIAVLTICAMLPKPVQASNTHYGWMYDTDADSYVGINQRPSLATDSNGYLYLYDNYYDSIQGKYGFRLLKSSDSGQHWNQLVSWATSAYDTIIGNIAIDPWCNYIYLAYQANMNSSWSAVGVMTFNTTGNLLNSLFIAGGGGGVYINPSVTCEYQFGTANWVYVAYEQVYTLADRDLCFAKSTNHGASFTTQQLHTGVDSTSSPWITEADEYIYIAYIENATYGNGEGQVYLDYSWDFGTSWNTIAHIDDEVNPYCRCPVVAASHGGGNVLVAYQYDYLGTSWDIDVESAYSTDYGSNWTGHIYVAGTSYNETSPALSVDGQGSTNNSVNGYFHIAYYNGSSEYNGGVMYARASVTGPLTWDHIAYGPSPINYGPTYKAWSDSCFAVTTQLRSDGNWYPIVAWPDSFYGPTDTDIFTTTPEARANLASSEDNGATVNLGSIIFNGTTYSLPNFAAKEAGLGTYQASYTPASGYAFDHWATTSGVSVSDIHANPTNVTVTNIGGLTPFGNLTAVYVKNTYLVVRGNDNGIYYRSYAASTWSGWNKLSGSTLMSPAATVFNNKLQIVVVGMDGSSLWYGSVDLGTNSFSGWTKLSGATPSAPTLASNGTVLCLVVRGMDNRIYYCCYSGSWGGWHAVPTGTTFDSPVAAMLGNYLQIVVRGMDGSSLWHTEVSCDGSGSPVWTHLSGATSSKPALASQDSNTLRLVVRGLDNRIYYRTFTRSNDLWGSWNVLPGSTIDAPGATVCNNKLYVVVRGSDGNSLWFYDGNSWSLISGATPSAPTLAS